MCAVEMLEAMALRPKRKGCRSPCGGRRRKEISMKRRKFTHPNCPKNAIATKAFVLKRLVESCSFLPRNGANKLAEIHAITSSCRRKSISGCKTNNMAAENVTSSFKMT